MFNDVIAPPYVPEDKQSVREKIARDIDAYLANGGAIQRLEVTERGQPMVQSAHERNDASMRAFLAKLEDL